MTLSLSLMFKKVLLYPFSDANFTIDEPGVIEIGHELIQANTPVSVTMPSDITKVQFGDGSVEAYTSSTPELGACSFTIARLGQGISNADILPIYTALFPEAELLTNGSPVKTAVAFTKPPAVLRTDWTKMFLLRLVDPSVPTDREQWLEGRVIPNVSMALNFSAEHGTLQAQFDAVGGNRLSNGRAIVWLMGDPDAYVP